MKTNLTCRVSTTTNGALVAKLEDHARHAKGAYSQNTGRAIRSDTAIWSAWCSENGLQALPADPEVLAAFIGT